MFEYPHVRVLNDTRVSMGVLSVPMLVFSVAPVSPCECFWWYWCPYVGVLSGTGVPMLVFRVVPVSPSECFEYSLVLVFSGTGVPK